MRVVTLLSDFGSRSPYPAQMGIAVLRRCDVALVDVTHDVQAHNVREGAYLLRSVVRGCPEGTVHLAVVDPGVGTARRGLAVSAGGQCLVGPDNGLLMPAAERLGGARAHAITNPDLREHEPSPTFHGRDVFAQVAAFLAGGGDIETVGPTVADPVPLSFGEGRRSGDRLIGSVIYADVFGNLITNLPAALIAGMTGRRVRVIAGARSAEALVTAAYGDVEPGAAVALAGSDGEVEIAVREGSAARLLDAAPGGEIAVIPL